MAIAIDPELTQGKVAARAKGAMTPQDQVRGSLGQLGPEKLFTKDIEDFFP